jgi:spoIIIJ-associated protein
MKTYSGKTLEEVVALACQEAGVGEEELNYRVTEEKKGLFSKKITIEVYSTADAVEFTEDYLKKIISALGLEVEVASSISDGVVKSVINTSHNSILIGKNGRTLQAMNELVRVSVNNRFHKRYRILLDINSYKDEKYEKLISLAKRIAKEVLRTKVNVTLDPMTSDERRVIHNALSEFKNIKTESSGTGSQRQITIQYIGK